MDFSTENATDSKHLGILFLISIICAFCAYISIFFVSNYASLYLSYDFDIPAIFDTNGITFLTEGDSSLWTRDAFITILLSSPLSAIIIGISALIIFMINSKKTIPVIFLLLWVVIFAFNTSFSILISDAIWEKGTYEVAKLMKLNNIYLIAMSIIYAFLLYKIGKMNSKLIMLYFSHLDTLKNRIIFFFTILIIPWIITITAYYFISGITFSWPFIMENIPVIIIILPLIVSKIPSDIKSEYTVPKAITPFDIIITIAALTLSILLIMLMQKGITITG